MKGRFYSVVWPGQVDQGSARKEWRDDRPVQPCAGYVYALRGVTAVEGVTTYQRIHHTVPAARRPETKKKKRRDGTRTTVNKSDLLLLVGDGGENW